MGNTKTLKSKAMMIHRSAYTHGKVQVLFQHLKSAQEKGKPQDYEIRVDDLRVVGRTNNLEDFDGYEEFVTEDTRTVTFVLYDGQSRRSTRHVLEFNSARKEEAKESREMKEIRQLKEQLIVMQQKQHKEEGQPSLESNFDEKLKHYRRDWDFDELKKKYAEQEKALEESRKEYEQLDKENDKLIEQIKEVKKQWESEQENNSLKQLFPKLLDDILKGKEQSVVLSGLSSLTGVGVATENKNPENKAALSGTPQENQKEEPSVTFRKKESPGGEASFSPINPPAEKPESETKNTDDVSEQDKEILLMLKHALMNCNQQQMGDVVSLLECISENPSVIKPILGQMRRKPEGDNQEQNSNQNNNQ